LTAVLTPGRPTIPGRAAAILLNAGHIHRVGPNGVYVRAARALANSGRLVCRFDFSGLGDSPGEQGGWVGPEAGGNFEERAVDETREVMNDLGTAFGQKRFVLIGLCSGADVAFRAACLDPRVVGAVLVNGQLLPAAAQAALYHRAKMRSSLRLYRRRTRSWDAWSRLLTGRSRVGASAVKYGLRLVRGMFGGHWQTTKDQRLSECNPALELRQLRSRRVDVALVYSDGSLSFDVYTMTLKKEIAKMPRASRPDVVVVRNTDHAFSTLASQETLIQIIRDSRAY
jgi:pimeloyl-ACP methyl ester carboxylesterase